jgi:DNA processing protein
MAKGIDSYAHTAVLKAQGYTVAVLGNGADICYPREHEKLYAEISERGCIVSEYPPGTVPRKYYFPQRNRLIAALSDELYVIEAGRNSGTRSTVDSCRKYGRYLKQL